MLETVSPLKFGINWWIPSLHGHVPSSLFLFRGNESHVAELIEFNKSCWREDRIRHLFLNHEVEAILQIPLNSAWPDDKIIWHHIPNDIYTVKYGYKEEGMNYMSSSKMIAGPSNSIQESKLWNSIHNLVVQPKIRCLFGHLLRIYS